MRIDNITLVPGTSIDNARIETGTTLPSNPDTGRIYFLTAPYSTYAKGLYVYDGTSWQNGDISSVLAGSGLTGGGTSGEVTLSLNSTAVNDLIATAIANYTASLSNILPYDIAFYIPTAPYTLNSIISGFLSPRVVTINTTGAHIAKCITGAATTATTFQLKANGTLFANVVFNANSLTGTITFTNGNVNITSGMSITLHTTGNVDSALTGIGITLVGFSSTI